MSAGASRQSRAGRAAAIAALAVGVGCAEPSPRPPVVVETSTRTAAAGAGAASGGRTFVAPEVIQRVLHEHQGRFVSCYRAGLDRDPHLAGRITLRFVIGADGVVTHVEDAGSDLKDVEVTGCVLGIFVGMRFPASDGAELTVLYPVHFAPNAGITAELATATLGPPARRAEPPETTLGKEPNGRLEPAIIQRVVRASFGRFRKCYDDGLARDPKLEGRVAVRFVIGRQGDVTSTADDGSDLSDRRVVTCVVKAFGTLLFPAPEGGIVTVVYPIMFSPGSTP